MYISVYINMLYMRHFSLACVNIYTIFYIWNISKSEVDIYAEAISLSHFKDEDKSEAERLRE